MSERAFLKSDPSFVQKTKFGWNKFSLTFLVTDNGWIVRPGLQIRFNIVEDIFHKVSECEKKYQKATPTIATTIENLNINGCESRFELLEENQIDIIANKLFRLFKSVAVPFFNDYDNLEKIENEINKDVESTLLTGPIFKGMKGLRLAKVLKNENYKELEKEYQSYYDNFSKGFYRPDFDRVKNILEP